jgi:hypothetical protein
MSEENRKRVFKVAPEGEAHLEEGEPLHARSTSPSGVTFLTHILSLKTAALIHLGLLPDSNEEFDLETAAHIIETLQVLKEKTMGNLSHQEQKLLEASLYELQVAFVKVQQG